MLASGLITVTAVGPPLSSPLLPIASRRRRPQRGRRRGRRPRARRSSRPTAGRCRLVRGRLRGRPRLRSALELLRLALVLLRGRLLARGRRRLRELLQHPRLGRAVAEHLCGSTSAVQELQPVVNPMCDREGRLQRLHDLEQPGPLLTLGGPVREPEDGACLRGQPLGRELAGLCERHHVAHQPVAGGKGVVGGAESSSPTRPTAE